MVRWNVILAVLVCAAAETAMPHVLFAQRLYSGSTSSDSQYSGGASIDSYGRAVNAEGRPVDRFGHPNNGTAWGASGYYYPSNTASGLYYPGGYSGLSYSNGLGYSVGVGGFSGGYSAVTGRFGTGVATSANVVVPPRTIGINGVYNSRTIMNNATRGGVVEYTHNGNGYVYSPGSSSQTVIQSGPSIFPTTTVVSPSQPPVLIQSQPLQSTAKAWNNPGVQPASIIPPARPGDIQLVNPRESTAALVYVLNGTTYTIKPGHSQSFADDRVWTIEFLRGGSGSLPVRYDLRAGTYLFTVDENGWDLRPFAPSPTPGAPPATVPAPAPAPSPIPELSTKPAPLAAPALPPAPSPDL